MNQEEILLLIKKYNEGKCSPEEIDLLETWYVNHDQLFQQEIGEAKMEQDLEDISRNLPGIRRKVVLWPRIAAAASIILALSAGGYFLLHKQQPQQTAQNQKHDILPGRNQATLTLANGQKIILTKALNGKLAQLGATTVKAQGGNGVSYIKGVTANPAVETIVYNTLSTSRGEQSPYPLILSDGTKVWLNAASSITFPTTFTGSERRVKVTGEVYFEVVHHAALPFNVSVKGENIEDIGTHFNINAYDDEAAVRTTLLEGAISVATNGHKVILQPGQQAVIHHGKSTIIVEQADTQEAIAWKEGMFRFTDESLASIMRKVSRWYDVDIEYTDNSVKDLPFGAVSTRFTNVSQVLKMMEMTKEVHFKIEGKTIIVSK
jgi:transmembrane sensor